MPYGRERWEGKIEHSVVAHAHEVCRPPKPFLTAADLVMLREMKIGLVPK